MSRSLPSGQLDAPSRRNLRLKTKSGRLTRPITEGGTGRMGCVSTRTSVPSTDHRDHSRSPFARATTLVNRLRFPSVDHAATSCEPFVSRSRQFLKVPSPVIPASETGSRASFVPATMTFRPFHDLRHTALTHEAAAGNPMSYIQLKAGHSQSQITERYIHATQVLFPGAAAKSEGRMFQVSDSE